MALWSDDLSVSTAATAASREEEIGLRALRIIESMEMDVCRMDAVVRWEVVSAEAAVRVASGWTADPVQPVSSAEIAS